jgi:uncharacterized membrane protein
MTYLVVKWLHILSSTLLFGTGLGSAYYMFFASRTRDPRVIAPVVRLVVMADWAFTTPTIILQPLTGLWMVHLAGYPLTSRWLLASFGLYLLAGAAWLPVVWMQLRMRDLARVAATSGAPLPPAYDRMLKAWVGLGVVAFAALVVVYWLMVSKPS